MLNTMKLGPALLLVLSGCAALEPAGGARTVYVPSPYGSGSQPDPMAVELSPQVTPPPPMPPVFVNPGLPPPRARRIDGPARICRDRLAVEIVAGERLDESNSALVVLGPNGGFSLEAWNYQLPRDADLLRAAGTVSVPGLGDLERIEITAPGQGRSTLAYVIRNTQGASFDRWAVLAGSFDGTANDLALLSRVSRTGVDLSGCA